MIDFKFGFKNLSFTISYGRDDDQDPAKCDWCQNTLYVHGDAESLLDCIPRKRTVWERMVEVSKSIPWRFHGVAKTFTGVIYNTSENYTALAFMHDDDVTNQILEGDYSDTRKLRGKTPRGFMCMSLFGMGKFLPLIYLDRQRLFSSPAVSIHLKYKRKYDLWILYNG